MIIDRYARPSDWSAPVVSDPLLQEMDWLLDDPPLVKLVRLDLAKHYVKGTLGRHPVPVEVTLRLTVLRRYKRWPYRQAQQEVQDSAVYRGWVRVYDQPVPNYSTQNELERLISAQTLHRMNDRLMQLAQDYRMSQGYRLRVDSSVTESNIHHPTDSSLLVDGVRVLSRCLERAKPYLPVRLQRSGLCSNHTRFARRRARQIVQGSRRAPPTTRHSRKRMLKKSRKQGLYGPGPDHAPDAEPGPAGGGCVGRPHGRSGCALARTTARVHPAGQPGD